MIGSAFRVGGRRVSRNLAVAQRQLVSSTNTGFGPAGKPPPSITVKKPYSSSSSSAATQNKKQEIKLSGPAAAKTAGVGSGKSDNGTPYITDRGPVSWASLFLVGIAAASIVSYYKIERERRIETAMGQVVSSESGFSPNPEIMAPRKFKLTPWGWFPEDDGFGAGRCKIIILIYDLNVIRVSPWGGQYFPVAALLFQVFAIILRFDGVHTSCVFSHNSLFCCSTAGKPAIGGPWSLVDLDGNLVTDVQFRGKWLLLYFGFARCPDICPSEMLKIGRVIDQLKESHPDIAKKIVPVFVSVDPARDSLTALKEYSKDFHPDYIFLTGSPNQVQQMAKKYRVYVSKADETEDGDYLVDHSIVVYFHDDNGELSDCFTQSMRPKDIIGKIVERMTGEKLEQ